jgi:hypothetical protein
MRAWWRKRVGEAAAMGMRIAHQAQSTNAKPMSVTRPL